MGYMSHHYRACRVCHIDRDKTPISKRGLCTMCATHRAMGAVAGMAATIAMAQAARAGVNPPTVKERTSDV
jgi:hypothetical protein